MPRLHRLIPWLRHHRWPVDAVLIVVLASPNDRLHGPGWRPVWVQVTFTAALLLPLLVRRRFPRAFAAWVVAVAWLQYAVHPWRGEPRLCDAVLFVAIYTLVVRGHRRAAAAMCLAVAAWFTAYALTWYLDESVNWSNVALLVALMFGSSWMLAEYVLARRAYLAEVVERASHAESERRAHARAAAAEERARIAHELHDVLAHSVSVMVVHAEGARLARHKEPQVVGRTLDTISATGRAALDDLRRLLRVVAEREPQPTVQDLRGLVEQAGTEQRPVRLTLHGSPDAFPASAGLQVFRIVQEALTNFLKHAAPDASAHVRVDFGDPGPGRVAQVEVVNTAGHRPRAAERVDETHETLVSGPAHTAVAGHGLAGMRARAALFHGTVYAGTTPEGGYRVRAELRLPDSAFHHAPIQDAAVAR
ncbi:sensor histidine kinase [Embleya sp. NPDC050154]|uniref:sensor histidine kinase n=1 Tax=Embleya sp. NPDC050154 TaxID=3363988 RepID=UPI00378CE39C